MADTPSRPDPKPVLHLMKDPAPKPTTGGGKSRNSIVQSRLGRQRRVLADAFQTLAASAAEQPTFGGHVVVHAAMFDDSIAPTHTPGDLFGPEFGAELIAPHRGGYLVQMQADQFAPLADWIGQTQRTKDLADISRVQNADFFSEQNATGGQPLDELWGKAPETARGRAFTIWLMPFRDENAVEHVVQTIARLRDDAITSPPPMLEDLQMREGESMPTAMRQNLQAASIRQDPITRAITHYRQTRHGRASVTIPSREALGRLLASGGVVRIDPVTPITSTAPGAGAEPTRPLPDDLSGAPVVGVVDGGLTANSYNQAEAWRAPAFVPDRHADSNHGNQITSLIVQGHDWNNNLNLPPLTCQVGTAQAVAKPGEAFVPDPDEFIAYLNALMASYPDTRVWNFSLNARQGCPLDMVDSLSHGLARLARAHGVLPVISVGNTPGAHLQPPADCEAALTVGGRLHDENGNPAERCEVSLTGPGPAGMLKPELSNFSRVRVLGGREVQGSSYATALTSPLAGHAMANLRHASPDLVKALLLHYADRKAFNPHLGFGTPAATPLPWQCQPGFVTLYWTAELVPSTAYYWQLPIPPSLRKTGKLKGVGALTAILNPHPMVSEIADMNYFGVRLETALQVQQGGTDRDQLKFKNLLGPLEIEGLTETQARDLDHKWSPVRHYTRSFSRVAFDDDNLRVYARVYSRDLFHYGKSAASEVPPLEAVFVLSIGTGDETDDVYDEIRSQLGTFVEPGVVETDIDIETDNS